MAQFTKWFQRFVKTDVVRVCWLRHTTHKSAFVLSVSGSSGGEMSNEEKYFRNNCVQFITKFVGVTAKLWGYQS
ncbi:MAG: hypothetical protein ACFB02_21045 [Mastigocoleus sp.]